MKKQQALGILWTGAILAGLWHFSKVPTEPTVTFPAEVIKLVDVDGKGRRLITVRLPDGTEMEIETLAPFFFKPGYTARVGVFERTLFEDVYDIVSDSVD